VPPKHVLLEIGGALYTESVVGKNLDNGGMIDGAPLRYL
jgi:hypothetical protein